MTAEQKLWMQEHPEHKQWEPHGMVSIYGWTDVGWVFQNGKFAADGTHHYWGGSHLMSSGDTLYMMAGSKALKVGREFMIC